MAEAIEGPARYFDGEIATRRDVRVRLADALEAIEADAVTARWPYASIRLADGGADALRLRCETAPELARIEIREKPLADAVRLRCGALGSLDLRRRDIARILIWSLAAAASIVAIALYGVPRAADGVARLVPASMEARLGDAAAGQVEALFGDRTCRDGAAQAALDGLLQRLASAGGLAPPPPATVLQTQIPNAFALPGGRVFVLSALIDKARSPDELGGVLAHELGHVAHRDGLRLMISNGGSAFLFSLLFGDVTGAGAVIFASRDSGRLGAYKASRGRRRRLRRQDSAQARPLFGAARRIPAADDRGGRQGRDVTDCDAPGFPRPPRGAEAR